MTLAEAMTKTRKELLQEYENGYLKKIEDDRVEKTEEEEKVKLNISSDTLQSFIFTASKANKKQEAKEIIDYCVVCNKGVGKKEMVYKNDHLFHPDCFKQHGSEYRSPNNQERENTLAKIMLVKLKNLQSVQVSKPETPTKPKKKTMKRKSTKKKSSRRKKTKRRAPKRKTARKTVKRRKVTKKRKAPKRKTAKKTVKRRKVTKKRTRRVMKKSRRRTQRR